MKWGIDAEDTIAAKSIVDDDVCGCSLSAPQRNREIGTTAAGFHWRSYHRHSLPAVRLGGLAPRGTRFCQHLINYERGSESRKEANPFYREARFQSTAQAVNQARQAGFSHLQFCQTVLGLPGEAANVEQLCDGYGEGALKGRLSGSNLAQCLRWFERRCSPGTDPACQDPTTRGNQQSKQ